MRNPITVAALAGVVLSLVVDHLPKAGVDAVLAPVTLVGNMAVPAMLIAYRQIGSRLERLGPSASLDDAIWVDLYRPLPEQAARVRAELGLEVPTLEDMEEIEISNRFYRERPAAVAPVG